MLPMAKGVVHRQEVLWWGFVTRSPPANDEKTSDFVTKFVNMGAATGSSIFFSGRKCDKSKQNKSDTWLCQLALSKYRVPPDGLSSASLLFDGHNWGTHGNPIRHTQFSTNLRPTRAPSTSSCRILPPARPDEVILHPPQCRAPRWPSAMPAESEASGICRYLEKFRKQLQKTTSTTT